MPMPPFPRIQNRDVLTAMLAELRPDLPGEEVHEPHVVSAALLRRFHVLPEKKLIRLPLAFPHARESKVSAKHAGSMTDFLKYSTRSAEDDLWGVLENHLPKTLGAAERGEVLEDQKHLAVLFGIIAIHLSRNKRYRQAHDETWKELRARERQRFISDPVLAETLRQEYFKRHEIIPPNELLGTLFDEYTDEFEEAKFPEKQARLHVEVKLGQLLFWLPHASLYLFAPKKGEFLIGDCPTVLVDRATGGFSGAWQQIGLDNAARIFMPLGPRLMAKVELDGEGWLGSGTVDAANVRALNEMQVRTALDYVFYRPGSGLETFAKRIRHPNAA